MSDKNEIINDCVKKFFKTFAMCSKCSHNIVCKNISLDNEKCEHFKPKINLEIYNSVYEIFDPVFEWLKIHYPSDDATFVIKNSGANMYINHGPVVCNKKAWERMKKDMGSKNATDKKEIDGD